jgi:hypothetical protein
MFRLDRAGDRTFRIHEYAMQKWNVKKIGAIYTESSSRSHHTTSRRLHIGEMPTAVGVLTWRCHHARRLLKDHSQQLVHCGLQIITRAIHVQAT